MARKWSHARDVWPYQFCLSRSFSCMCSGCKSEMPFPLQLPRLAQSFCIYIYIHIWMHIDHLWSQLWVSPLCSGTLLQLPYMCIYFSLCSGFSAKKMEPRKIHRESQWHFAISLFHQRLLTRSPSLRAQLLVTGCLFFSFCSAKKKCKNSEPVTCAWASTVPFRSTYAILKKKGTLSHFLKLTLRAQLFSGEKIFNFTFYRHIFFKKPWASTRVLRKHDGPERARW